MAKKTDPNNSWELETTAIRAGFDASNEGEHSEAIFATSSFTFDSAEQAAARFSYEEEGNVYSRFTNPNVRLFEQRLAALENGESCVATASGMAAILSICMTALKAGDHVVVSSSIFGATKMLFNGILRNFGVSITFVSLVNLKEWQNAFNSNTKMVFFETPTNPLMEIGDIAAISDLAHQYNPDIKVVVDNCFCTPISQRPLDLGADVVMHSATKLIDGQGRCVGGAVVGDEEFVGEQLFSFMRTAGTSMSPFNAWVFSKGLETLAIRVKAASENATEVANWLVEQSFVKQVYYPGLSDHPQYELASAQQRFPGSIVTFEMDGGREAAWALINQIEMLSLTANLGDTRTTITHPATTTHARWSQEDKLSVGITEGLIRLSIGLESPKDIIDDLSI
jgi:O-succinylhomoserine sulfhydrylase